MLSDAVKFIRKIASDDPFRLALYELGSDKEKLDYLSSCGYDFHPDEVENAVSRIKNDLATPDELILLDEILMWWNLLLDGDYPPMEKDISVSECSPSGCKTCSSCR